MSIRTDGSSVADAHERVEVDREEEGLRWRCPNNHTSWERTNSHLWCHACHRRSRSDPDVDPEHYEIYDAKHDREIPFSAVEFAEPL